MPGLDDHRDAVDRALNAAGVGWDAWPLAAAEASMSPPDRLSALLLLLGAPQPRTDVAGGWQMGYDEAAEVIDRVRRRKLPWDADTARLALDLAVGLGYFDDRRVGVALRGAELVCGSGNADTSLLDALQRCLTWMETQSIHVWAVPETTQHVRRVLAAASPPELLDLTLLRDGDAWVAHARAAARGMPADAVAPLVRVLGSLGPRKPSKTWQREAANALREAAAADLLERWLRSAAETDVVAPDAVAMAGDSRGMLFAHGNDDVVRAAVLAAGTLTDASWVPSTLGVLARRGAATSGGTGALALAVAGAAIDSLVARGGPADSAVLRELLEDLTRRDLVKRIGAAIGEEELAARRDRALRREKAAAIRRKANPAPREARASVERLLRQEVAPVLRAHGFTGSGRTWRRFHADRVDVVALLSGTGQVNLEYGTRYLAAHPTDEPFHVEPEAARSYHLDVRLGETWEPTGDELARCSRHLSAAVVPFLDSLGRHELLEALVEHGTGRPPSARMIERVDRDLLRLLRPGDPPA